MVLADCSVKEDLLTLLTLKEAAGRGNVYSAHKTFIVDNMPIETLAFITIDGVPSMARERKGFVQLCRNNKTFS
jgi:hypothetical protein